VVEKKEAFGLGLEEGFRETMNICIIGNSPI
jgi:hypothetical protein